MLTDAQALGNAVYGPGTGSIYLANLVCSGNESILIQCLGQGPGAFCSHREDAGVRCRDPGRKWHLKYFPSRSVLNPYTWSNFIILVTFKYHILIPKLAPSIITLYYFVQVAPPCVDGDLRLFGGQEDTEGTIEVCQSGLWQGATICDDLWDSADAAVACRQLGYESDGN